MNTTNNFEEIRYQEALQRVKKIKGFYIHLVVYIVINIMIFVTNVQHQKDSESIFRFENFATVLFWGIGLLAHGLSVFGRNIFFGKNWEERKIQELMDKEKSEKWE